MTSATRHNGYNWALTLFFLLACPILSLPFILQGIYKQERSAFFLFSLFLGLLAWLQVPLADLFRHSLNAYNYGFYSLSDIFGREDSSDYFIPLMNWVLMHLHIPYQYLRLVTTTESFFLLTIIFNYMIKTSSRGYTRGEAFKRFCILWLFFEFLQMVSGVRYVFALCQYVFAMHLAFNKRSYIKAIFFAWLAMKIHMSFSFLIPIGLVLYLLCTTRKNALTIWGILSMLSVVILSRYSYLLGIRADWYFSGGSDVSGDTFEEITIYGLVLFIGIRLLLVPFIVLNLKNFNSKLKWNRMFMANMIVAFIFITNAVLIFRFAAILSTMCAFFLLETEAHANVSRKMIRIILWCGIATTFLNGVNYRGILLNSRYQYLATPVPVILHNQYDRQWIINNVDGNHMKEKKTIRFSD